MSTPKSKKQSGTGRTSSKGGRARAQPAAKKAKVAAPKRASSPKATGQRGPAFEHRVQATKLLAMCLEVPSAGVPTGYLIQKLLFQARPAGHHTDDLVLTVASAIGGQATVRMQMKAKLAPTAKNLAFQEAVGAAWLDFKTTGFQRGADVSLIVYDTASASSMSPAVEVARLARASSDAAGWFKRCHDENVSNQRNRDAYAAIKTAVETHSGPLPADEELHQFVVHLKFIPQDLDSDTTAYVDMQKSMLGMTFDADLVDMVWAKLVDVCVELNGSGGEVTLETFDRHVPPFMAAQIRARRVLQQSMGRPQVQLLATGAQIADTGFFAVGGIGTVSRSGPSFNEDAPATRASSPNKVVSRALESIDGLRKDCRFSDALEQLEVLGQDMGAFDSHQRALWYWLRGTCRCHLRDDDFVPAADDLLKAAEISDDEDKFAAGQIQAYLLKNDIDQAAVAAKQAAERFPLSISVWAAAANVRIAKNERLTSADIPAEHVDKTAAWHLVAASQEQAGDLLGAFESARNAVAQPDVTFFSREAFLRFTLQLVAEHGLHFGYRIVSVENRERLGQAVAAFADRPKTLWRAQTTGTRYAAVTHLAFAFLLLDRASEALALIDESRSHEVTPPSLYRAEIEALRDLDRSEEVLDRFDSRLQQLPDDALVSFAQIAMEREDLLRLDAAVAEGATRKGGDADRAREALRLMRWDTLIALRRTDDVRGAFEAAAITPASNSIPDLMFGVRAITLLAGDKVLREALMDRLLELGRAAQDRSQAHLAARMLFHAGRYEAAAEIYEQILPLTAFSELHSELLYSYIRSGQRAKARRLLQSMPPDWKQSTDARHMALDLAQMTADWALVTELAELEIKAEPKSAGGWILRVVAAANTERSDLSAVVGEVPEDLDGTVPEECRLAGAELRFGHVDKGLRRLYRTRRRNMNDVDAAARLISTLALTAQELPSLTASPEVSGPGTALILEDDEGGRRRAAFDPESMGDLPETDEFVSAGKGLSSLLYGLRVGDSVGIPQPFSEPKSYRVVGLQSAFHRLGEAAHQAISDALQPPKFLASMTLKTQPDGTPDFEQINQQLVAREQYAKEMLDFYKQHPATLGMMASQLNKDVIDLVVGWPGQGPKLEVSTRRLSDAAVEARLELHSQSVWVADLGMLTELAILGHLDLLGHLPKVLVSSSTYDAIAAKLEEAGVFRRSGTMFSHEGKIGYRERTEADWRRERQFLESMLDAVRAHCTVLPSYGPEVADPQVIQLGQVLSVEEYASLLLALEHKASLLVLDDRFRALAASFGLKSVWPQELLVYMSQSGWLSRRDYALATMKMLVSGRTFISVNHFDLIVMMDQGGDWPTVGINALRAYLSDPEVDFQSAYPAILNFLGLFYRRGGCEFGVALDMVEYFVEALLRHPRCPEHWFSGCIYMLWFTFQLSDEQQIHRAGIVQAVARAIVRLKGPMERITFTSGVWHISRRRPLFKRKPGLDDAATDEKAVKEALSLSTDNKLAESSTTSSGDEEPLPPDA